MSIILLAIWLEYVVFCYCINRIISIMTSESPTENRDFFNYGRSTPPPTTSFMANKIEYEESGNSEAAALIEPKKDKIKDTDAEKDEKDKDDKEEKDKEKDDKDERVMGPGENPGYDKGDRHTRDDDKRGDKGDKDGGKSKDDKGQIINGDLPGNFKSTVDGKIEEELEDDDTCFVKCLYYTMQCCECTIS